MTSPNVQNKRKRKDPNSSNRASCSSKPQQHHHINPLSDARKILGRKGGPAGGKQNTTTTPTPIDRDSDSKDESVSKNYLRRNASNEKKVSSKDVSNNNTITRREERKARELWHKKSGAGFALFVEYYGGQSPGVVNAINTEGEEKRGSRITTLTTKNTTSTEQRQGQSRASKKRRRKKINNREPICKGKKMNEKKNIGQEGVIAPINSLPLSLTPELSPGLLQALTDKPNCEHIVQFLATMSRPLPLTFRLRHTIGLEAKKNIAQEFLQHYSSLVGPADYDSTLKEAIYQSLPKTNLTKFTLGKISSTLKSTLIDASNNGSIARQEIGSMLPVIALSRGKYITCGSKVLDLCASPGSKTLQALEVVTSSHSSESHSATTTPNQTQHKVSGRIVANDIHPLRLESLKKAIERSGIPSNLTDRIRFTNHDAAAFPTPKSGSKFDCILADVPCSGDGTIRKDTHILPTWMPSIGNALHNLQLKILKRALKLVKVGGVVVYSTCSLNPVEDEAVVASTLRWANQQQHFLPSGENCDFEDGKDDRGLVPTVELLEWPDCAMPEFKRAPGVAEWRIADYNVDDDDTEAVGNKILEESSDIEGLPKVRWYDTFEDATKKGMKHASPSMWPPTSANISTDINLLCLNRCIRVLPQDNDTGSFFLALLKKNKEF